MFSIPGQDEARSRTVGHSVAPPYFGCIGNPRAWQEPAGFAPLPAPRAVGARTGAGRRPI